MIFTIVCHEENNNINIKLHSSLTAVRRLQEPWRHWPRIYKADLKTKNLLKNCLLTDVSEEISDEIKMSHFSNNFIITN